MNDKPTPLRESEAELCREINELLNDDQPKPATGGDASCPTPTTRRSNVAPTVQPAGATDKPKRRGTWLAADERVVKEPATGDWPEDAADEDNGRYQNTCHLCGKLFIGHKRRATCKVCAAKPTTGEWTAATVSKLIDEVSLSGVADAHNAALALQQELHDDEMTAVQLQLNKQLSAEREVTFAAQQSALKEGIRSGELEKQLKEMVRVYGRGYEQGATVKAAQDALEKVK